MPNRYYQTCLNRSLIAQSLTYEQTGDVLYLNNAKSGCSTIKNTILTGLRKQKDPANTSVLGPKEIHGASPYWSIDYSNITTANTFSFSVVRNPFTRILSSFLDKMGSNGLMKSQFYWQQGLAPDHVLTLGEFLKLLKNDTGLFDQHWRPQVSNLYVGFLPLDEVHFLESLNRTQSSVCERLAGVDSFVNHSPHGTHAHTKVAEHIDDEAEELIVDLYKDDFEVFGYSTDRKDVEDAPSAVLSLPVETPLLTNMLARMPAKHTAIDGFAQSLHALGIVDIAQHVDPKDTAIWRDCVIRAIASDNPAHRYLALSIVTGVGKPYFEEDFSLKCCFDIVQIAPYQIGNHANLVRRLGAQGRFKEAHDRVEILKKMTWQDNMIVGLLEQLDNMENNARKLC